MNFRCSRRTLLASSLAAAGGFALPALGWPAFPSATNATLDVAEPEFWYGAFRKLTLFGLSSAPGVGGVLSAFGGFLLPEHIEDPEDVRWRAYVKAVNKLIDAKIDDAVYNLVKADLAGITKQVRAHNKALESGDPIHIRSTEDAINVYLIGIMPRFMEQGPLFRLLPLFVPAANIHLGLLRQAAQRARRNGEARVADDYASQLDDYIHSYGGHYDRILADQLKEVGQQHPHDHQGSRNEPWAAVLALRSNIQISLGDVRDCWPYFSERQHPGASRPRLDRELLTPLLGSYYDCKQPFPTSLPSQPKPEGPIIGVGLGGYQFLDGMELRYGAGKGPGRVRKTVIGGTGGKWTQIEDIEQLQHIVAVDVGSGDAVNEIQLTFGDGSRSPRVGGGRPSKVVRYAYDGHRLSSVMGFGTASGYGGALSGCVFGFQLLQMEAPMTVDEPLRRHLNEVWPQALAL